MNKKIFIVCLVIFNINIIAQTELKYNLDSLIITANRTPSSFSSIGRSVEIINNTEIKQLPATTIQDILEQIGGVDVRKRGIENIQSDISIRGGSFEQTLILIDGIKLTDPQTGHHNMNLPISLDMIERIEVLKGQSSGVHGANAFGGVINILTKRKFENTLKIFLQGGENAFYKFNGNASYVLGKTNHHISLTKSKSDGYKFNTAFETHNFSFTNSFNFSKTVIKTLYGYTDKKFGANSFYTTKFPKQAEKIKTHFASIVADIELGSLNLQPKLYWRKNDDEFVLNKDNPTFYKNNHHTNVYGSELQLTTKVLGGTTSIGLEYNYDNIQSNNLGEHNRNELGIFAEQKINLSQDLTLNFGGYFYDYSSFGWKFLPEFNVAYLPLATTKIFASYGRAFRIPTYTELYYNDPITNGNPNLAPEETTNYELGISYNKNNTTVNVSFFRNEGINLIDYVKDLSSNDWNAKNITTINTTGFELSMAVKLNHKSFLNFVNTIKLGYTYLDVNKLNKEVISRYTLRNLKHNLTFNLFTILPFGIRQSWSVNYGVPLNLDSHFTIDTKLQRKLGKHNIFLKVSNLLNIIYEEIPGVSLPGRWIIGGVKISLF